MKFMMRLLLTISIWGGLMFPMFIATQLPDYDELTTPLVLFSTFVAMTITIFAWAEERIFASFGYYKNNDRQKQKRTEQNAEAALLLLDLLSDEERYQVRQRLMRGTDGELPQIFTTSDEAEYVERY